MKNKTCEDCWWFSEEELYTDDDYWWIASCGKHADIEVNKDHEICKDFEGLEEEE